MGLFATKSKKKAPLPSVFSQPENPVNYNSVLDYLVGLSAAEYTKMTTVTAIYREANEKVAEVLGVPDQPTTTLVTPKPTDEEIDEGLDAAMEIDEIDFETTDEPAVEEPKKEQAPSTKINISAGE